MNYMQRALDSLKRLELDDDALSIVHINDDDGEIIRVELPQGTLLLVPAFFEESTDDMIDDALRHEYRMLIANA